MVTGKNQLTRHTIYYVSMPCSHESDSKDKINKIICKRIKQYEYEGNRDDVKTIETYFTLNGKRVQAKDIGKVRYEITDENGNVSYISHDGYKLKPEYVISTK